ncbi:MAG: ATP-binding cassette domain-containing protein [Chloroflexota bacterium]|nr:MAG: ATP-binding cassette domain-containing protein [Chloroflexota bacterium]
MEHKRYGDLEIMGRVIRQTRPYWAHIAAIFLLGLLAAPLALLTPLPLTIAVDSVIGSEPLPDFAYVLLPSTITDSKEALLILATLLVLLIALLTQLQTLSSNLLRAYTGEKLVLHFRADLFRHLQRLSLSYHDVQGTADSIYRIQYDSAAIRYLAIDGVTPFVSATVTLAAMLIVMFRLDWQLALVALLISPILFFIARLYRRRLRQQSRQVRRVESSALSVVQEVLASLRVVMAFGQEDREQQRFEQQSSMGMGARLRYTLSEGTVGLLLAMTIALGTAIVLYLGVRHVFIGIITLGQLLLIMGYLAQLYGPLKTVSRKTASLQPHLASAERAFALEDIPSGVPDPVDGRAIARANGGVSFQSVSFSYDGSKDVLRDITFSVPAGKRIGIAGETGAGKSTVMGLLTRFYDPQEGQITLDGVDLREYKLIDLRNQFAIVLQDTVLFSTTIAENIAYARSEATEEEIFQAAKAANAHDFIIKLPDGYDTQVGERGMLLSGGERQRIALARAFLKDAPILILDEPTSSVDVKTESGIIRAMVRLMKGRTTFLIAHRLSTLTYCDLLMVIQDGRLVDVRSDVPEAITLSTVGRQASEGTERNGQIRKGRPLKIEWHESLEELEDRFRMASGPHMQKRLEAFYLLRSGETIATASESVSVGYRTLQRWVAWYRQGGLEEVLRRTPGAHNDGTLLPTTSNGDPAGQAEDQVNNPVASVKSGSQK